MYHIQLPADASQSMEALQTQRDIIAVESFAGADSLRAAVARLPALFGSAQTFYAKFMGNPGTFYFKTKDLRDTADKLTHINYADIRNIDVLVPEGLATDLLAYVRVLNQSGDLADKLESEVLAPFETWLGTMLGAPENLRNLSQNLQIPGFRLHDTKAVEKKIQDSFTHSGRRESLVKYGKAFHRNQDIYDLVKELEKLERAFGLDGQKRIVKLTERITMMMGELVTMVHGNPDIASPAAVKNLSDITFQLARELEHYGLLRYRITELSNSITETQKAINTFITMNKAK